MSCVVFSLGWNPKEVGGNASKGMDGQARQGQGGKERELHTILPRPYIGFQQKVWPRLQVCLRSSRPGSKVCVFLPPRSGLEMDSSTSNQAKHLSQVCPHLWIIVHSKCRQSGQPITAISWWSTPLTPAL